MWREVSIQPLKMRWVLQATREAHTGSNKKHLKCLENRNPKPNSEIWQHRSKIKRKTSTDVILGDVCYKFEQAACWFYVFFFYLWDLIIGWKDNFSKFEGIFLLVIIFRHAFELKIKQIPIVFCFRGCDFMHLNWHESIGAVLSIPGVKLLQRK